jgi:hypothetical protein
MCNTVPNSIFINRLTTSTNHLQYVVCTKHDLFISKSFFGLIHPSGGPRILRQGMPLKKELYNLIKPYSNSIKPHFNSVKPHGPTTDLANLPNAQLMLECRLCKADTTLYIATDFHSISWRILKDTTR